MEHSEGGNLLVKEEERQKEVPASFVGYKCPAAPVDAVIAEKKGGGEFSLG